MYQIRYKLIFLDGFPRRFIDINKFHDNMNDLNFEILEILCGEEFIYDLTFYELFKVREMNLFFKANEHMIILICRQDSLY